MGTAIATVETWITMYGLKLLAAVIILFAGRYAAQLLQKLVKKLLAKSRVDETLVAFLTSATHIAAMTFVIIAALGQLGVQTASFVAVLGAAGLAVGLALQGSLSNFAAGVLLIIFKPFKVGNFVEIGGTSGTVEEIGIFTTELKTPDNKKVIVPNAKATGDNIVNYSANDTRRVDIVAGVSYDDDLDKVRRVLEQIIKDEARILAEPAPRVAVLELADSSVNFAVRPWVKTNDYWDVYFALQEQIKKRFDAENISIPFPQRDVHMVKEA